MSEELWQKCKAYSDTLQGNWPSLGTTWEEYMSHVNDKLKEGPPPPTCTLPVYWPDIDTERWEETTERWSDDELQVMLEFILRADADDGMSWIRDNCDGTVVKGASEKLAWKRYLRAALAVMREWEVNPDKYAAENRESCMLIYRFSGDSVPVAYPTDWRPEIRQTITALKTALGEELVKMPDAPCQSSQNPKSRQCAISSKEPISITYTHDPTIYLPYRDSSGKEKSLPFYGDPERAPKTEEAIRVMAEDCEMSNRNPDPNYVAEWEARERYDPMVEREMERRGLHFMWAFPTQQDAKKLLATNSLNIHTITWIDVISHPGDPSETFCLELTLDFWLSGYFEHDPDRYIRKLRIAPPELEQIAGLRSWLKTRWMELYPDQAIPDILKRDAYRLESAPALPGQTPDGSGFINPVADSYPGKVADDIVKGVAAIGNEIHASERTVKRRIKDGMLKVKYEGSQPFCFRSEIERYLKSCPAKK